MAQNDANKSRQREAVTIRPGLSADAIEQIDRLVADGLRIIGMPQSLDGMLPNIPREIPADPKPKNAPILRTSISDASR
jgi:hypothetical protein